MPARTRRSPDPSTERRWGLSLAAGAAVLAVVAVLLDTLTRTVEQIEATAGEIWQAGTRIAGNTVHVPLLGRINQIVGGILEAADGVAAAAARIERALGGGTRR